MMDAVLRRKAICLAAVAVLSLIVHLKGLRAGLLDYHLHRQVNTAAIARNYAREDRPIHKPRIDWEGGEDRMAATEMPLYMWLYGRLWGVGGLGEDAGRVISVVSSMLTAMLLFLLFEREFGRAPAFFGAALFCVMPLEVYFGRTVQPEGLALLALVSALWFWDVALRPGRPAWAWALATFCVFVAAGLKLPYFHVFFPLAGLTWRRLGKKSLGDGRTWAAGLVAAGAVVAWYVYARQGVYVVPTRKSEFLGILDWANVPYYTQFLLSSRFLELVTTYGGFVFFAAGAREVLFKDRDVFWWSWWGGALFHLIAMGSYSHQHEYTALTLVPPTAALMGVGLWRLLEKARAAKKARRAWALAAVAVLALSVPVHAALRIGHWYRQGIPFLNSAGEAARAVSLPDDLFVASGQASSVFLYYLDRRGWSVDFSSPEDWKLAWLDEKTKQGARFFMCETTYECREPDGYMWKLLSKDSPPAWNKDGIVIFPLGRLASRNVKMKAIR
jgi:hypothetical protein